MAGKIRGITIELGGDTKGLVKSLNDASKSVKGVQTQLKDVNKLLKVDPKNTELLTQKQDLLKKQVEETKNALEKQKQALQDMKNADNSEQTIEAQNALQREIIETEQKLKSAEGELKNFGSVGAQQAALVGEKMQTVGEGLASAGESLTKNVTLPLVALGTASVKVGMDFDTSMSQVAATMGMTAEQMEEVGGDFQQLRQFAQDMGSTTAFSASQAAEGLNYMALAGYSAEESMEMLPTVLNLAAAGAMELGEASDMVTDTQSAMGLSMEETAVLVDQMAKTSSKTNTSVAQLGAAMLKIGPTARGLRGGTAELAQVLGLLADNGIKGAEGGTHLRNIMLSLGEAVEDGVMWFDDYGVAVYDAEGNMRSMEDIFKDMSKAFDEMGYTAEQRQGWISEYFNKADLASVNALLNTTSERWEEVRTSIDEAEGSASTMADTQLNNLGGSLTLLKSALEGAAIAISDVLSPAIKDITEFINRLVTKFNELSPEQQKMIVVIGGIVAAIGPLLLIIGKTIVLIGQIISMAPVISGAIAAINAPILPIIAAIAALIAIGVLLWKNWDEIKAKAIEIWEKIKKFFVDTLNAIKAKFTEIWNNIKTFISTTIESIKTKISETWTAIKTSITETITAIKTKITEIWNGIKTAISSTVDGIKTKITETWTNIKTKVAETVNNIKTNLSENWNNIKETASTKWNDIKGKITGAMDSAKTALGTKLEGIKSLMSNRWETMKSLASSAFTTIGKFMTDPIGTAKETISKVLNTIKNFFPLSIGRIFSDIKLPHFSVTGEFPYGIGGKGVKPSFSIEWYAQAARAGAIFNREALFGFGNGHFYGAGDSVQPELLIGTNTLSNMIASAVAQGMNSGAIYNAVLQGASNAHVSVYIDGKDVTGIVNKYNTSQQLNRMRLQGI